MISVPAYIEPFADNVKINKDMVSFSLKCKCGCESLRLARNNYTDEESREIEKCNRINEKKVGWHSIHGGIDEMGKTYHYIKVLGVFKKYFEWEPEPLCAGIKVVKAICTSCENEIIVFDNRSHGYDSADTSKEAYEYIPHFDGTWEEECGVTVKIEQNEESDDSNMFSNITIYTERNGKKKEFFDMETA